MTTHVFAGIAALPGIKTSRPFHASYEWCRGFLDGLEQRRLASHVWIVGLGQNAVGVKLYDTVIVKFYKNGTFSVSNEGFNTLTTAYRISQFTPEGWTFWHAQNMLVGTKEYDWENCCSDLTHKVRLKP